LNLQVWADTFLLKREIPWARPTVLPGRQKSGRSPSRPTSPEPAPSR
jgi:hypothetical protein